MAEEISPLENHGWWMERLRKDAKANQPKPLRLADALANLRRWHELTDDECDEAAAELRRLHEVEKQYNELLYAVGNKYENESRYRTALRYIQQAEAYNSTAIAKAEGELK